MRALCGFIATVWEGIHGIEAHKKQGNPSPSGSTTTSARRAKHSSKGKMKSTPFPLQQQQDIDAIQKKRHRKVPTHDVVLFGINKKRVFLNKILMHKKTY